MLKQRIITALILVPLVLAAINYLPTSILALLFGLIILIGASEWAVMAGVRSVQIKFGYPLLLAVLMLLSFTQLSESFSISTLFNIALIWWFIAFLVMINLQTTNRLPKQHTGLYLIIGILVLLPAWMSLLYLHGNEQLGPEWVFYLFAIIWTADTGAYFAGRAFGKHKLADKISPGKTWEGVLGGLVLVSFVALLCLPYLTHSREMLIKVLILSIVTVLASILGDLVESVFKRIAGMKDSGHILPGHGGIMDRIDSLTASAPVFTAGLIMLGLNK